MTQDEIPTYEQQMELVLNTYPISEPTDEVDMWRLMKDKIQQHVFPMLSEREGWKYEMAMAKVRLRRIGMKYQLK